MKFDTLIIGGGHAAFLLSKALRKHGYRGSIGILNGQDQAPYQRPLVSKQPWTFGQGDGKTALMPASLIEALGLTVLQARARCLQPQERRVVIQAQTGMATLDYENCVLATGARPQQLDMPSGRVNTRAKLLSVYDAEDAMALTPFLKTGVSIAVIGGGILGLEVAAAANAAGARVELLERQDRLLQHLLPSACSEHLRSWHQNTGLKVVTACGAITLIEEGNDLLLTAVSGHHARPDLIVTSLGTRANTELASDTALHVDDGFLVDHSGQTNIAHLYALGDCARFPSGHGGYYRSACLSDVSVQASLLCSTLVHGAAIAHPENRLRTTVSQQGKLLLQLAWSSAFHAPYRTRTDRLFDAQESGMTGLISHDGQPVLLASINDPRQHLAARKELDC